jgi:hypothetical protein
LPGDLSTWDAEITILPIDYPEVVSPFTIPITLTQVSGFHRPKQDTLDTGCKELVVYNTGRLGGYNNDYSLNIPNDCDTVDQFPDASIYLYDGSPMISWVDDSDDTLTYTSIHSQVFTDPETFFPHGDITKSNMGTYYKHQFTASTTDSIFGIDVTYYVPTNGEHCFIIGKNEYYLWDSVEAIEDVYVGQIIDWDIPSDSEYVNGSDYESNLNSIWQYGAEYHNDNQGVCNIPENDRLGGISSLSGTPLNAWTESNSGHFEGPALDPVFLHTQMSTLTDYAIFTPEYGQDSLVDLHTGMTFDRISMAPGQKYTYFYALVTTNQGETDHNTQVESALGWAISQGTLCCCTMPGDANNDAQVNVGDAVYIISYVFKGGLPPVPHDICNGDANGDCQCNVGDAVYIISYVFKGGDPPVATFAWINECGAGSR